MPFPISDIRSNKARDSVPQRPSARTSVLSLYSRTEETGRCPIEAGVQQHPLIMVQTLGKRPPSTPYFPHYPPYVVSGLAHQLIRQFRRFVMLTEQTCCSQSRWYPLPQLMHAHQTPDSSCKRNGASRDVCTVQLRPDVYHTRQ